ncbi:MAG: hypothetical protein INR73_03300 [Williamsia sp.]|nr:hypothetical protein [Williamsia sp.]
MRSNLFLLCLLLQSMCYAQPAVDALLNAERSFASTAASTSTRKAFLGFLDSSSIVFSQGEILNGYTRWSRDIPEDSSLLLWRPRFAVLSASGDFGCTMGPSEYRPDRAAQTAGHFGHFASLWHRSKTGRWTVLCDIGIHHNDPAPDEERVVRRALQPAGGVRADTAEVTEREQEFIEAYKSGKRGLLKEYSVPDAWILVNDRQPVHSREMDDFDETVLGHYQFEPVGRWLSPAGDMLVSYGKTTANQKKANYMWVWIADRGKWQLMMMVMN